MKSINSMPIKIGAPVAKSRFDNGVYKGDVFGAIVKRSHVVHSDGKFSYKILWCDDTTQWCSHREAINLSLDARISKGHNLD